MSNKRKKSKNPKRKGKSPYADLNISRIQDHKLHGKQLLPPLSQIPQMHISSWADDHMPEMLWAVLLTEVLERRHYLECFRRIAAHCAQWFAKRENEDQELHRAPDQPIDMNIVVDHTKLTEVTEEEFRSFIEILLSHPLGYAALRPLLLLDFLPGLERWKTALNVEPTDQDWNTLGRAVGGVLDHQSERSTDIRWFKYVLPIIAGRMFFMESMAEHLEELRLFPDKGDMRRVRPSIRAGEMGLRRSPPSAWIGEFWAELLSKTECIGPSFSRDNVSTSTTIDSKQFYIVRSAVIERFLSNLSAKRADARQDSAFGLVLYALSIIEELGVHNIQNRIVGRLAMRALVEANITLRYLVEKDQENLWKSYRVYGAGQAKLAFLKAQEAEGDLPSFIDEKALYEIANEDKWQEFLAIDIGHWANSNLRKLASECGAKDLYDKYYDWASTYAHSHWGAVRDTNFVTCHNPLHRLHRIPRLGHRRLNSIEGDALDLVNQMLVLLDRIYPGEADFEKLSFKATSTPDEGENGEAD